MAENLKSCDVDGSGKNSEEVLKDDIILETHPWDPYIPQKARVLIMGTFPPQRKRWSMDFYYPNKTNDFWYMMGLIFFGDRLALLDKETGQFDISGIRNLLDDKGIALNDTGHKIRRLKGNASDKYLEIVEPVDLGSLMRRMPECRTLATTGEKAATVLAELTQTPVPKMGTCVITSAPVALRDGFILDSGIEVWRMPSTSRAYPMKLEFKADHYRQLFRAAGITT